MKDFVQFCIFSKRKASFV